MTHAPANLDVVQGDITTLDVEMIVNAANSSLLGGGGVDGAIHAAAGPGLLEECRALGGALTGEVKLTGGHGLAARWVGHAVGPIWRGGSLGEPELLASCYRRALEHAHRLGLESIAFPCISTGIFGYPVEPAARIAIDVVGKHIRRFEHPRQIVFCCFSDTDRALYERLLDEAREGPAAHNDAAQVAGTEAETAATAEEQAAPADARSIEWSDFEAVHLRAGTVLKVEKFPEARKPAFKLLIDFGSDLGVRRSSAQITDLYEPEELVGRQVVAVTNFPPKQIGPYRSEVLVTGFVREDGAVVLVGPDQPVPDGTRLA
jgi:export-related chaperone CsaA